MSKKVKMAFLVIVMVLTIWLLFTQKQPDNRSVAGNEPDYSLVWYGQGGQAQKAATGVTNPYFDSKKPTIIFIHGWMPDQVEEPPTFMVDFPDPEQNSTYTLDVAAPWVDAGWNIGIFYWHPF